LGWLGLLAADLLGRGASLIVMATSAARAVVAQAGPLGELPARALLRRYWRFPILSLPSSFLDALALALPIPLITSLYGVEAAGLFVLVQLVLALPTAVIGASVADAFHGQIAQLARETPKLAVRLFWRTGFALFVIGAPITVAAMTLGPLVFDIVFGPVWHAAGPLVVVMAPWALASLIVSPLSRVVFVYEGQALKVIYDLMVLALVFTSLSWSAQNGLDLRRAVTVLSIVRVAAYAAYLTLLIWLMRRARDAASNDGPATAS
jgi:O-antigen/teichoic acid export membrane protein